MAAAAGELVLPPVVVTEILSDPSAAPTVETYIADIAASKSATAIGCAAQPADTSEERSEGPGCGCTDCPVLYRPTDVALITRDRDFRHFAKHCGLRLA